MRFLSRTVPVLVATIALLALGCSSDDTKAQASGAGGSDAATGVPDVVVASSDPYPEATGTLPVTEGDIIPNLRWHGYVNPEGTAPSITQPLRDYSLDDVRLSGKEIAILHLSAAW